MENYTAMEIYPLWTLKTGVKHGINTESNIATEICLLGYQVRVIKHGLKTIRYTATAIYLQ